MTKDSSIRSWFQLSRISTMMLRLYFTLKKKVAVTNKFISSIVKNPQWADLIYVTDLDNSPCFTSKKDKTIEKYEKLDRSLVYIVKSEIESWYLSGTNDHFLKKYKIKTQTKNIPANANKEFLSRMIKNRDRISFLADVLDNYSVQDAIAKNASFKYVYDHMTMGKLKKS